MCTSTEQVSRTSSHFKICNFSACSLHLTFLRRSELSTILQPRLFSFLRLACLKRHNHTLYLGKNNRVVGAQLNYLRNEDHVKEKQAVTGPI